MHYAIEDDASGHRIAMNGAFTFSDSAAFRALIKDLERSTHATIVLDMKAVEFIDSSALGMLLLLREEQQKNGGAVLLRQARGQVRKMFDLSNFKELFTIED